jgi:hypothetical protein
LATHTELSQKLKTVKLLRFTKDNAKSALEIRIQALEELIREGVEMDGVKHTLKEKHVHQALLNNPLVL